MSGCVEGLTPVDFAKPIVIEKQPDPRRIEVTINESENGSSCRVTYPPDPEMKDLRWATGAEASFCHDLAQEARIAIEAKGWICNEANPDAAALDYQDQPDQERVVWLCSRG
jgi:hypothetical protein